MRTIDLFGWEIGQRVVVDWPAATMWHGKHATITGGGLCGAAEGSDPRAIFLQVDADASHPSRRFYVNPDRIRPA